MSRALLIAGAAVLLSAVGVPAQQVQRVTQEPQLYDCERRIDDLRGGFGNVFDGEAAIPAALGDLRSAARRLVAQDRGEACLAVVDAMEVALGEYDRAGPEIASGAARGSVARLTEEEMEARLLPMDEVETDTAATEGTEVYNYDNQKLGEVEGLLVEAGRPTHLVIEHGGFWKIKPETSAIPVDIVRWDPEWEAFFAPLSEEALDNAPVYGPAEGAAWDRAANDSYFADSIE